MAHQCEFIIGLDSSGRNRLLLRKETGRLKFTPTANQLTEYLLEMGEWYKCITFETRRMMTSLLCIP